MLSIGDREFDAFRKYIERSCAIALTPDKKYLVESRLTKLLVENGCTTFSDFYDKVLARSDRQIRDRIVDAITTNETYWFRDAAPWQTLRDVVLPRLTEARGGRKVRIWSAACSTGQEPYSVAMLIDDLHLKQKNNALAPDRFEIIATDISTSALYIAMAGNYDQMSINRGLEGEFAHFKPAYFKQANHSVFSLDPRIKRRVTFKRLNLQDSFASLGDVDLILMRNVAIYFSDEFKRDLYGRLERILPEDGFLLLGSSESAINYTDRFQIEKHGRCMLHRPRTRGSK